MPGWDSSCPGIIACMDEMRAVTRDFTVAVFVVHEGRVLLHWHRKLGRWLPPGGHIEPNELPDEAAVREVREEAGVACALRPEFGLDLKLPGEPVQLVRPAGVQLADISPGHQHVDLVYFATVVGVPGTLPDGCGWFGSGEWSGLGLSGEVLGWCARGVEG